MLNLIAFAVMSQAQDPAFALLKTLVGGQWEGQAAPGVKVKFIYTLEQNDTVVLGIGTIDDGKKQTPVRATLGWDPAVKKVYYLDQHGSDTVYFGHVEKKGNALLYDFNALSGDSGHYRMEMALDRETSRTTMSYEEKGKWTDLGLHVQMQRKRYPARNGGDD